MISLAVVAALAAAAAVVAVASSAPSSGTRLGLLPAWEAQAPTDEQRALFQPGLPLLPAELADYAEAVAHASGLSNVPATGTELDALVGAAKGELSGLNGGQLGALQTKAVPRFKELAARLRTRLQKRATMLPPDAGAAGHGASLAWYAEDAASFGWNWTQTDWFGRHFAGGDMWQNLGRGPAIVSKGIATTAGIVWEGIKAAGPYLELAASFIPVYGPWIVGALHLAYTGDLDESTKAALRAAIPGGPLAQMGVDFALSTIEGEPPPDAALAAFFAQYPEAKAAYEATLAAKGAIQNGDPQTAIDEALAAYQHADAQKKAWFN